MPLGLMDGSSLDQDRDGNLPRSLNDYRISGIPSSMFYVPDFVTTDEEAELLKNVYAAPRPQWRNLAHRRLQSLPSPLSPSDVLIDLPMPEWLGLPVRRLMSISSGKDDAWEQLSVSVQQKAPRSNDIKHVFSDSPHRNPNHCLINEYLPGQGIMFHEDGPTYFPITATVSLGAHTVLDVKMKSEQEGKRVNDHAGPWRVLCEPRSLLVTSGYAYTNTLHGIEAIVEDLDLLPVNVSGGKVGIANWDLLGQREEWAKCKGTRERSTRISLTYRDVLKTKSLKAFGKTLYMGKR